MFTGIIQAVGKIDRIEGTGGDTCLHIDAGALDLSSVCEGHSIAVSGVCLTVVERREQRFAVDVSRATLRCTTLSMLRAGVAVNLEKALTPSTPLGGHLVMGHVDGVGILLKRRDSARSVQFRLQAPPPLAKYIAAKGSICVDGVSLTVNSVQDVEFEVNIVPHTLTHTTLKSYAPGRAVNLEVDILARYLERLLETHDVAPPRVGITQAFLARHGFIHLD